MNIIGIAGRREDGSSAGAGKDEVAKVLAARHGYVIVSFADPIKRIAMDLYQFSFEQLWGSKKEEPDPRYPREHGPFVKQHVGAEAAQAAGWSGSDIYVCACCGAEADEDWQSRDLFMPKDTPPCFLTPRWACRAIGTEMGRMLYSDTWVDYAIRVAKELFASSCQYTPDGGLTTFGPDVAVLAPKGIVIPDVRWPAGNEGEAIKKNGGRLWLVVRPGTAQTGTAVAKHASETQPIPDEVFDRFIQNDCSLASLESAVGSAIAIEHGWKPFP